MKIILCSSLLLFFCCRMATFADEPQVKPYKNDVIAFPGAEGYGRYTTGGRGGKVYHVTSLEDDGSQGTFRWALKQKGAKTIIFDVAGTIHLKSELRTEHDSLTIAGQTSPGGICLADYGFSINSNNVIIRFLRFRPGEASGEEPDGLGASAKKDIIIDHCSISWSVDECLSVYGTENSTVQWCIVSETLRKATLVDGTHGYSGNRGGKNASYHHNLIAHCESRVPRPTTLALTECVDIRNNVFYNWVGNGCYDGEDQHVNLVNNYYKPGPATEQAYNGQHENGKHLDSLWTDKVKDSIRLKESLAFGEVTTHEAPQAYLQVLKYAGCCNYRDAVDQRILSDVRNKKATCTGEGNAPGFINSPYDTGTSPWPELKVAGLTPPIDSDGDGIPDEWELKNGLDPQNPADGSQMKGWNYTNLEIYLNSLVKDIVDKQTTGTMVDFCGQRVFSYVEEMPQFPGGARGLKDFMSIPYPSNIVSQNGAMGRVIIQCVIEKDGRATYLKLARGVEPYMDKAAMKLVEKMPRWTPGRQDGELVRVLMTFPVMYKVW